MAVEHLLTRLLICVLSRLLTGLLPSPPESPSEGTITASTQSWFFVVLLEYQWIVRFPKESTSPFSLQNPLRKRIFLITVVDILFTSAIFSLSRCAAGQAKALLSQGVAILCVVEIVLYMYRSLFSSGFNGVLMVSFAINWVAVISLAVPLGV